MLLDEILKVIPKKFNIEKHRRLYINAESIDKNQLKKIESIVIRGFRVGVIEALRYCGYKVSERVLRNAERLGPNPDVLWLLFRAENDAVAILSDSIFHTLSEKALERFKEIFITYVMQKNVTVVNALFTSLHNTESYILRKLFLTEIRITMISDDRLYGDEKSYSNV
jgi:hypothetical protein